MMENIIEIKDLHFSYSSGDEKSEPKEVLKGIDLNIKKGEFVAVLGHNGSGKSTLLRAINRLIPISGGTVLLEGEAVSRQRGRALRALRRKVGMIFQNYNLVYSLSVLQNVLHGRLG